MTGQAQVQASRHSARTGPERPVAWLAAAEKRLVAGLLLLFIATGIGYSLVVPPFETPDEIYHYAFARHLSQGNGLPVQGPEKTGPWEHEGSQPPLYYALVGLAIAPIDQSELATFAVLNPRANLGDPLYPGNKNFTLYSGLPRPLQGVNLAVRVGRWISVLLGALTVLLTYLLSRHAFPRQAGSRLLATALVATIPQFSFISASVSNDNIINAVSAAVLLALAGLLTQPDDRPIRWWQWSGLGLLLGLAGLSKLQGLGLVPLSGLVVLWLAQRRQQPGLILRAGLLVGLPFLAMAGWWYARNLQLYGDLFGMENLLSINGLRREPVTWAGLVGELRGLHMSFWGIFGWFSILLPRWTYAIFNLLTAVALLGALASGLRHWRGRPAGTRHPAAAVQVMAGLWVILLAVLFAYWISISQGVQGRLLFPAIGALAVLGTVGLRFWTGPLPAVWRTALGLALPLGLWLCSLYALAALLPDAYGLDTASRTVAAVPEDAQPIGKIYGDGVELVAARLPSGRFRPGDSVPVTLYFRAHQPQRQDHELFIQLLDNNNIQLGNVTTHPGWGVLPLSLWQPGVLYADSYRIPLAEAIDPRSPVLARIYVGFIDSTSTAPGSEGLLPVAGGGPKIESRVIGTVEISTAQTQRLRPLDMRTVDANFGDVIRLTGYRFPPELIAASARELPVTLFWEGIGAPHTDFTAFVHLVGPDGAFVASYDQPPAEGRFPTSHWQAGDVSLSKFPVALMAELPPGTYQVWVGLYSAHSAGLERVPVVQADRTVQDNRVLLGAVQIR